MAYKPPSFNLFAAVYSVSNTGTYTLRGYIPCQLRGPANSLTVNTVPASDYTPIMWEALFPAGADLRPRYYGIPVGDIEDAIELTPGSGRFYNVIYVDDKAAGFTNEYRLVLLEQNFDWSIVPMPRVDPEYVPPALGPWVFPYTGP